MNISKLALETIFNANINLSNYQISQDKIVYLTLTINCKGEQFNFKVLNSDNEDLTIKLADCVKSNVIWTPAQHNGRPVDYSYIITIRLKANHIQILDDTEKKKPLKKH
jgi:hypothetical protein